MSAKQQRLKTDDAPARHLLAEAENNNGLGINNEREFYCADCGWRVTLSPDGKREYGHGADCEHKLERSGTQLKGVGSE